LIIQHLPDATLQAISYFVHPRGLLGQGCDQVFGCGCRGFDGGMGHPVENGVVLVVPQSSQQGHRVLGGVVAEVILVKTLQVSYGTTPSDNDHHVEGQTAVNDPV
jgi:hypothetical protein